MHEIETDIEIHAPAKRVWATVADLDSYSVWNPFIVRAAGILAPRNELDMVMSTPGGMQIRSTPTVLKVEEGRHVTWKATMFMPGLFDRLVSFDIEEVEDGRVQFRQKAAITGALTGMKAEAIREMEAGFVLMNEALKTRAELAPAEAAAD